jgi:hypothetical protein
VFCEVGIKAKEDVMALKVFREGKGTADMLKHFDLKQRHHYFLVVYKNIV